MAALLAISLIFAGTAFANSGPIAAWGSSSENRLAVPDGLTGIVAIAAGGAHSLALKDTGTVVAWGSDQFHQLDMPDGLSDVKAIAAGDAHSLALKNGGTVAAWGDSFFGQTTIPSGLSNVTMISAGERHSLALKSDGTVAGWGEAPEATIPPALTDSKTAHVTAIAAGSFYSLAVTGGKVVLWGSNAGGALNPPADLDGVVAVAAGRLHALALKSNGTVVEWGFQDAPSVPAGLKDVTAISAGDGHYLALQSDGTVVGWSPGPPGDLAVPAGLKAVAIAAGAQHDLALWPPLTANWATSLPGGQSGKSYPGTPVAAPGGGTGVYTYSVTQGALPQGLVIDPSTGVISGSPTGSGSTFTITVTDAGDSGKHDSKQFTLAVQQPTTTQVTSSSNSPAPGEKVVFTATVNGHSPTGTVTFQDNGVSIGSAQLTNGVAQMSVDNGLTGGDHPITAVYSGDANNSASTSPVFVQHVTAGKADVRTTLTAAPGAGGFTYTLTVSNAGPDVAKGVQAGFTGAPVTESTPTSGGFRVINGIPFVRSWSLGDIAPGKNVVVKIKTSIWLPAIAAAAPAPPQTDPNTANNMSFNLFLWSSFRLG